MLSDTSGTHQTTGGRFPLLAIFFLSGASGLIYQVVWNRGLLLVFGSTTHATSTVLAAFMGGLAIGSIAVGRRGDRFGDPLKVYAVLEVAIAILSLAVLAAIPWLAPLYRVVTSGGEASVTAMTAWRLVLACLVLLPPTALMGATLPILSAYLERRRAGGASGSGASALYAANTVGAVAGTALAGFMLLPALGMMRSALVAAGTNLIAAVAALRLARARAGETAPEAPRKAASAVIAAGPGLGRGRISVLMLAFAVSGAGALVFEVVWTRILSLVLGSSTQAFTIMLTTFLAGLALGSAVATRALPRIANPMLAFAIIELGAGAAAYLGIYLFPELPYTFLSLYRAADGPSAFFHLGRFALTSLVMLPPTLCLGAAFPLAARAALQGRDDVAAPVAALYTANTFGAIAGALAAGFALIPALGLQGTLIAGCLMSLVVAALLLAASPAGRPTLRYALAGLLAVCLPGLAAGAPEWNAAAMTSGVFQYAPRYIRQFTSRRLFREYHRQNPQLFYRDGPTTTVTVERRAERYEGKVNMVLTVNGKVDASSTGDMETQVLVGHLPFLVSPAARTAMVIGLASGVSAGSVLTHPVDSMTIAEIEPAMVEAQSYFEEINGRPLEDRRVTLRLEDARNELLVSGRKYDTIISEPSNPWIAGPSKLFTREFFELARSRLRPGGVLCQWVQLYGLDADALKAVLRTFSSVFPHRLIFKGAPGDLIVLGSEQPLVLDESHVASRLARPEVAADLGRIKVRDLSDILFRFRLGGDDVTAYAGWPDEGPLNTDDNGLVEFSATRTIYREDHMANDKELAAIADVVLPHVRFQGEAAPTVAAIASRLTRAGHLERAGRLLDVALAEPALTPSARGALLASLGELQTKHGRDAEARVAWAASLAADPRQARAAVGLAGQALSAGDTRRAMTLLQPVAAEPLAGVELARARWQAGDKDGVLRAVEAIEPRTSCTGAETGHDAATGPFLHLYRGRVLASRGEHAAAVRELKLYFELFPAAPRSAEQSLEAVSDLARAHLGLGQTQEAIVQFRVASGLADSLASWNRGQAERLIERRELEPAARHLETALRWNGKDHKARRLLAYVLNDLGRHEGAIAVWSELDTALEGDVEALRNIASLSLALHRPADALTAFRKLRSIEPDPVELARVEGAIRELETGSPAARLELSLLP